MSYTCTPLLGHFGAEVRDISLDGEEPLPAELVTRIKEDMKKHRVLVFKGQGRLSGARQVQISRQLGTVESTFYKHPKSPHPDIFRVSNDEYEGCVGVGRTGWHVDGTFQEMPFKYQTMHFHSVCEGGETWFVPLKEFYEMQDAETKARWERYWMLPRRDLAHPLVYKHPVRQDTTLLFHCGPPFVEGWIVVKWQMSWQAQRWRFQGGCRFRAGAALLQSQIQVLTDLGLTEFLFRDLLAACLRTARSRRIVRKKYLSFVIFTGHESTKAGFGVCKKAEVGLGSVVLRTATSCQAGQQNRRKYFVVPHWG
ncbi:unnamed protein product, partial [Effrenium voratum]